MNTFCCLLNSGWRHDGYETQMDVKENLISYSGMERWNRSGLAR